MKTELFENAHLSGTLWKHCFSVYVWTEQNGTFRKRWRHTISSKRWWTGASLSCLLSLGLFLTSNCLFSSKFSFVNSSSWLLQKVTEHYQVSFATGVKRRKVGSPFSLTFFCPEFAILNCSCDFEERHNYINIHQRNSKVVPIYYFAGS